MSYIYPDAVCTPCVKGGKEESVKILVGEEVKWPDKAVINSRVEHMGLGFSPSQDSFRVIQRGQSHCCHTCRLSQMQKE